MLPTANWRASRPLYQVPPSPDVSTKIGVDQLSPRRGICLAPTRRVSAALSKHIFPPQSCQLVQVTVWYANLDHGGNGRSLGTAAGTVDGKLMPPLTGIGEALIHHAAVVQIWQTPGPADEELNPYIPDREAAHGFSITHPPAAFPGRILQSAREAHACRELLKELVESDTYAVMVLKKPSRSSFVAALCMR